MVAYFVLAMPSGTKPSKPKGKKSVRRFLVKFCMYFTAQYNSCLLLYISILNILINALFTSTTVFLPLPIW